jgi:hypothetical protein
MQARRYGVAQSPRFIEKSHQSDSQATQSADSVRDIGMHRKAGEAIHDVLDRVLSSPVERKPVEAYPQGLSRDAGERLAGVDGGQGEASRRSPANQIFAWYPGDPTSSNR